MCPELAKANFAPFRTDSGFDRVRTSAVLAQSEHDGTPRLGPLRIEDRCASGEAGGGGGLGALAKRGSALETVVDRLAVSLLVDSAQFNHRACLPTSS
jgi:hypothetical protein